MATFIGANVEELRELASTFDANGQALESTARDLTARVATSSWEGADQQRFVDDWHSRLRVTLLNASSSLQGTAHLLRQNAAEQEEASGVGGSIQSPVFARGDSDKPGDPEAYGDDMGPVEDWPAHIDTSADTIGDFRVSQGQVGDCWFLAALGAVASQDPEFLSEHIRENDDGTYTVTFYDDGEPVEITVNPNSPANSAGNYGGEPNWATIYEKAAAEFFGGDYEDINSDTSDRAFEAITGNSSDSHGELSLTEIQDALADGPVALGTETSQDDWFFLDKVDEEQIVPNHAYVVTEVAMHENTDGDEELMIHVVNPWGPGKTDEHGQSKWGDQWLTEEQYRENFDSVYTGTVG